MPWIAGVDGCKGGWIAVLLHTETGQATCQVVAGFAGLIDSPERPAVIAVDMPIGLACDGTPRACDREARRVLGPRRSSVFPPPLRAVIAMDDYAEANMATRRIAGKGLMKQAFNLAPKIRQVEEAVRACPSSAIRECHPEVSFWAMNENEPIPWSKKTPQGQAGRRGVLRRSLGGTFALLEQRWPGLSGAALDDFYDACATLWTARRILAGEHVNLPPAPPRDTQGLPMEIVY